jgi:hypothetical protein
MKVRSTNHKLYQERRPKMQELTSTQELQEEINSLTQDLRETILNQLKSLDSTNSKPSKELRALQSAVLTYLSSQELL